MTEALRARLDDIESKSLRGERIAPDEAELLLEHEDLVTLGAMADLVRRRLHPDRVVTYIIDRNVNYTNVCNAFCTFCAFYRAPHHEEGYVLPFETIERKVRETYELGGNQILLQGGHNPDLKIEYYEDLFRRLKARFPSLWLHALSPPEVVHIRKVSRLSVSETLRRLRAAGLDSLPGGGAEILVDDVRRRMMKNKASSDEWLEVMEEAHHQGLRSTATMMFGHIESRADRVEHLRKLRELQDRTKGFTAFIGWTFQPGQTEMGGVEATTAEYLRTMAVSRIFLDNFENVQASWVTQGPKVGAASLAFGVNDMGSTMIEENVVSAAGTTFHMNEPEIVAAVRDAGFVPVRRNMLYERLPAPLRAQDPPTDTTGLELSAMAGGTRIRVRAKPGSRKNSILGVLDGALKVAVAARPDRGRANAAVAAVLAKQLGIAVTDVVWLSGLASRDKTVLVPLAPDAVRARLSRTN